jgi:CRP/FNR family transcriptional regulator, cyclic AMP receptor protein
MPSSKQTLSTLPMFQSLDQTEIEKLNRNSITQLYQRKSNIFMEGEDRKAVYFVHSGIVKIYSVDAHGNENIVHYLREGNMFPHSIFFDDDSYPVTAEVVEDAVISALPVHVFEQLLMENQELTKSVIQILGRRIRDLNNKIQEFCANDVNLRIASLLIRLANEHGVEQKNGILINLQLTNQEVAYMAGTTRESVNRLLNQLKKNGTISVKNRKIVIHRLADLQAYIPY